MKVTIITSRYPENNDPYNHMFVHTRCLEMMNQGVDVEVFVPSIVTESYTYELVQVHKLPVKKLIKRLYNKNVIYLHLLNIYPFSQKNGWPIYKHIIKNKLRYAIYIHGYEAQKYSSRFYEFNFTLKETLRWFKKDVFVYPQIKYFVNRTMNEGGFVFPSKWMKTEMEKNFNCKLGEYHIIPNGIDTDFFTYRDQSEYRHKLLTIRSLSSKVYDIEKTIEVMSNLPEQFTLDIYGEGVYLKKYQKLINIKRLGNRVKIISTFVERGEMRNLFRNYGIFISTTKMDSQGVTMMEAMAAGLLVATTDNSSKKEFIKDFDNGILAIQAEEIAEKIMIITKDKTLYEKITVNGRQEIELIDITKTVELEIKYLSSLINSNLLERESQ